jgi:hypothetical protein
MIFNLVTLTFVALVFLFFVIFGTGSDTKLPAGWRIVENYPQGKRKLEPRKLHIRLEPEQEQGRFLKGSEMRERLTNKPHSLTLDELCFLQAHPELIPSSWKDVFGVTAWNTIVNTSYRGLYVPRIGLKNGAWCIDFACLSQSAWGKGNPAGVFINI